MIKVRVKDFHGNARCDLELRDVATGTIVDVGELNEQKDSVTLQPQARPLVYCAEASPEGFDPGEWDAAGTNNVNRQIFQGLLAVQHLPK